MRKKLLILTGSTSSGKTHIERLAYSYFNARHVQTATTRDRRPDDSDGYYSYLSSVDFIQSVSRGEFIEHARYGANFYGTPVHSLLNVMHSRHQNWSMVVESQGAESIGRYFAGNSELFSTFDVACVVLTVDRRTLLKRLIKRMFLSYKRTPANLDRFAEDAAHRIEDIWNYDAHTVHSRLTECVSDGIMGYSNVWLLDNTSANTDLILNKLQTFFAE